jgi:peroxiredoxin
MKRFYFSLIIGLTSLSLSAQTTTTTTYKLPAKIRYVLPDGKIINSDKLDSVLTSWGNRRFGMTHDENDTTLYKIFPATDAGRKKEVDDVKSQLTMLHLPAPDFSLKTIDGKTLHLEALKGKVIVLNFWFTTCGPCREEMPALNKIKSQFEQRGVMFLGLPLDDEKHVAQFLTLTPFNYIQLPDAGKVHAAYKVISCPTSMVIDKNGVISFIQVTGQDINSTLPKAIQKLL